jgi:5'-nucleotidase
MRPQEFQMKRSTIPFAMTLLWALVSSLPAVGWAQAVEKTPSAGATLTISLLALNDFHGNIMPPAAPVLAPDAANPAGTRVSAGGAAYLSTLVRGLKQQNPARTLLVAAGDMVGASQLSSGLFHDEPTVDVLNHMGLDVASVGNHEFDRGSAELLRLQNGGCFPPAPDGSSGVVGRDTCMNQGQFAGAKFPYLAANVRVQATGKTLFAPYDIRTVDGVKIGFIGLTLRDTPSMVVPSGVAGLAFEDEVATINALVPVLQSQGVTVIVVLIHQGGQTTARTVQDKSCPGLSGEIVPLADRLNPAVDVVVSGHTHQEYVCTRPSGLLITQSGYYGRLLTKIDLLVDRTTGKVLAKDANNLVVVNDQGVKDPQGMLLALPAQLVALAPDPEVGALVRRYGDLSASISDAVIGRIAAPLTRQTNAAGESALGAVIADAYLVGASRTEDGSRPAQIAFTNPGGIRSDLASTLSVTFGQLFNVLPFNNTLVSMDLTGQQIVRLLEQQWERASGRGVVMSVSQGFGYTWDASAPPGAVGGEGRRVLPGSVTINGESILAGQYYRVVTNNFLADGGDGFTVFRQGKNRQTGEIDSAVVKLYFRMKGAVQVPASGRIQSINQ